MAEMTLWDYSTIPTALVTPYSCPTSPGLLTKFLERDAKEEQRLVGQVCHSYSIPRLAQEGLVVRGLNLQKRTAGVVEAAAHMICINDKASQIV